MAFNSYRSKGSSGFTMAGLRFMYRSMSKVFFLSASDKVLGSGDGVVISNLSLKNGRTPSKLQDTLAAVHHRDLVLGHQLLS